MQDVAWVLPIMKVLSSFFFMCLSDFLGAGPVGNQEKEEGESIILVITQYYFSYIKKDSSYIVLHMHYIVLQISDTRYCCWLIDS